MAVLKILPIEMKGFPGLFTGIAIPAIGENDSTDIPKEGRNACHVQSPDKRHTKPRRNDSTAINPGLRQRLAVRAAYRLEQASCEQHVAKPVCQKKCGAGGWEIEADSE
jgi:hypothetical protein